MVYWKSGCLPEVVAKGGGSTVHTKMCHKILNIFVCIFIFQKLVVKPDQLIKRRGKLGLIKVNVNSQEAKKWIDERMGKDIQVCDWSIKYFSLLDYTAWNKNGMISWSVFWRQALKKNTAVVRKQASTYKKGTSMYSMTC